MISQIEIHLISCNSIVLYHFEYERDISLPPFERLKFSWFWGPIRHRGIKVSFPIYPFIKDFREKNEKKELGGNLGGKKGNFSFINN